MAEDGRLEAARAALARVPGRRGRATTIRGRARAGRAGAATLVGFGAILLWSALALYLQALMPWNPSMLAAAIGLPVAFLLINDLVVMPTEEAMLRRLHRQEFDAYASRVRRWFGRRAVTR